MTPNKLIVTVDGNVLELVSHKKEVITYQYIVSKEKMGMVLVLDQAGLDKMLRCKIVKEL